MLSELMTRTMSGISGQIKKFDEGRGERKYVAAGFGDIDVPEPPAKRARTTPIDLVVEGTKVAELDNVDAITVESEITHLKSDGEIRLWLPGPSCPSEDEGSLKN